MHFIYKIPGPILVLLGGFALSWGGLIIRSFESANIWQILFYRSLFFLLALITFLFLTYGKETIKKAVMTSSKQNFQKIGKVSTQVLYKMLCVKFH